MRDEYSTKYCLRTTIQELLFVPFFIFSVSLCFVSTYMICYTRAERREKRKKNTRQTKKEKRKPGETRENEKEKSDVSDSIDEIGSAYRRFIER